VSTGQDAAKSPTEDDDFEVVLDCGAVESRTVKVCIGVLQNLIEASKLAETFGLEARTAFRGIAGINFGWIEIDVHCDTGDGQCDSHEAPPKVSGRCELGYVRVHEAQGAADALSDFSSAQEY
jgi:hypothetical protein